MTPASSDLASSAVASVALEQSIEGEDEEEGEGEGSFALTCEDVGPPTSSSIPTE